MCQGCPDTEPALRQQQQQLRDAGGCSNFLSERGAHAGRRTFRATGLKARRGRRFAGVTKAAPGKGMRPPLRQEILNQTFGVIQLVRPIVEAIARRDRDLASQVRRAMSSVGLNLAEGFGTAAGNARLRFETARGSLYEAQAGIGIAMA